MINKARDGTDDDNLLGSKELIIHPWTSIFSWNIPIHFFQSWVVSPPYIIIVRFIIELWDLIDS